MQKCPLAVADVGHLPFREGSFDLVLCLEVLEHLPDPYPALTEFSRVARNRLLLSCPWEPYFRLGNLLRGKDLRSWGNNPGHLHQWTKKDFLKLIQSQCSLEKWIPAFPWQIALCLKTDSC